MDKVWDEIIFFKNLTIFLNFLLKTTLGGPEMDLGWTQMNFRGPGLALD